MFSKKYKIRYEKTNVHVGESGWRPDLRLFFSEQNFKCTKRELNPRLNVGGV
jgi:hypothetical protein